VTQLPTDATNDPAGTAALRLDVVAGLTAAAVVLPKAMAYATVAGLPVAVGLYTAFIPMVVYALLGSSRVLSVSSTATLAILTGAQLGLAVPDGDPAKLVTATASLAGLVGVMLLLARLMRLGFVANFISTPVLTGFKAGIGLVIVLDQVPKLLGIHIAKQGFFLDLLSVVRHMPDTSLMTLAVAAATLLVLIGMERLLPHSPAPLVAVGGGIAAAWLLGLQARGVSTVGLIPPGLPSITLPDLAMVEQLIPGALGIALMSFTESIAAGRAFASPGDPHVDANRELIATGAANLGGALLGAMPAGGGTSQTAVVRATGGRSQKASLVTAGAAAAVMLLLAPVLGYLPHATLAAVVRFHAYAPQLFGMLPMLLAEAAAGQFENLMAQSRMLEQLIGEQIYVPLQLSVMCAEDAPGMRVDPADAGTILGTEFVDYTLAQCAVWPRGRMPGDFHDAVKSDLPVLLLSGELDPVTPPRYADEVQRALPNSRHFVFRGQGHSVMGVGCGPRLVAEFIAAANAKALDGRCLEQLQYSPPFGGSYGWDP